MEQLCYYVNSRGLLKSCDFHSKNPKSSCNNDYGYLQHMIKSQFDNMSIYVCSHLLKYFFKHILPKINKKFILVSGDSDLCIPKDVFTLRQSQRIFLNPFLLKWFAQNTQIQYIDKMVQLPIGVDYHTISNNPECSLKLPNESSLPRFQESILLKLTKSAKPFYERTKKIYVNFTMQNDLFGDRKQSLETIPNELLEINQQFTPRTTNWQTIVNYAFVLSPFGCGMDCHRTWEALCLGSIPIVKAPNVKKMFQGLPVLIVQDWTEVTQELLDKTIEEFTKIEFTNEKLSLQYWVNQINNKS
jgi:hypothetical protein